MDRTAARCSKTPGSLTFTRQESSPLRASSLHSLTEEVREPRGLVVMDDGHTSGVEGHEAQHNPVKHLGFNHVADGDAQKPFLVPEVGSPIYFCTFDAGSGKRCAYVERSKEGG